ncbi:hypothetical protein RQ831_15805 [Roseomonas gilardii]|uniref:Uncharacterized protein n=1 Tax=Roseomonas gilardii TaxID=257708 RepID=A0ABU3MHR3_9PROT|nr:hypothetical protein [Roseomonas gilardii]MDT8332526.1 hypothetical protein [Roseomonas gilardii]
MANLPAIVKATRASASALAAQQRWGRAASDLSAQEASLRAQHFDLKRAGKNNLAAKVEAELGRALLDLDKATKACRAAHTRWTNAQAVLAANPLPGDR